MAKKKRYPDRLTVSYPKTIYTWIQEESDRLDLSMGEFVRKVMLEYYDNHNSKKE